MSSAFEQPIMFQCMDSSVGLARYNALVYCLIDFEII